LVKKLSDGGAVVYGYVGCLQDLDDGDGGVVVWPVRSKKFVADGLDAGVGELDAFVGDALVIECIASAPANWGPGLWA